MWKKVYVRTEPIIKSHNEYCYIPWSALPNAVETVDAVDGGLWKPKIKTQKIIYGNSQKITSSGLTRPKLTKHLIKNHNECCYIAWSTLLNTVETVETVYCGLWKPTTKTSKIIYGNSQKSTSTGMPHLKVNRTLNQKSQWVLIYPM